MSSDGWGSVKVSWYLASHVKDAPPLYDGNVTGKVHFQLWMPNGLNWCKLNANCSMFKLACVEIIETQLGHRSGARINDATETHRQKEDNTATIQKKSKWKQEIKQTEKTAVHFRWLLMTVSVALGGLNPFSVTWKITATQLIDQTIPAS